MNGSGMNHQQASPYQHFFQNHDVTTGNFHHAATAPTPANFSAGQPNMANAFMLGQTNIEDFYHNQTQHMPLAYHQAVEAAAAASNHILLSQHQPHQRYVLPPTATAATNPYFSPAAPFATGNYSMAVGGMDQLSSIKYQHQNQSHWRGQAPTTASLFPSIFAGQQQPTVADAYFNPTTSQSPPGPVVNTNSPLAGLRALSEQYSYAGARRTPKSPSKSASSSTSSGNLEYQQRQEREGIQPATPNMASAIASPPTARSGPGTGSPQQSASFVPPSPVLKSQTTHNSPLSASTSHSSHGGGSFLVGSPATPRQRSVSSTGSGETHADPKSSNAYSMADGSMVTGHPFSIPAAPMVQQNQVFEESLSHPSAIGSFYSHGIDPSAALIDPTTATLFGAQVVGSDPSLHSAVDDAFSMLGRDVNYGDLSDINCANMMVGHNFWDDLGDTVLDDPLLGPNAAAGCSASDLVNSNNISGTGTGGGVLLHSVLEFGTMGGSGSGCGNGHASADEVASYRFQDDVTTKRGRSSISSDLIVSGVSNTANTVSVIQPSSGDVTVATPKLREKMKRKAQGENEFSEIDRAFARHLSMVAEKNEFASRTVAAPIEVDETPLDLLTADTCLTSRMKARLPKADRELPPSPVRFEQTSSTTSDFDIDDLKRDIRKMLYVRKQQMEKAKQEEQAKRKSVSAKSQSEETVETRTTLTAKTTKKSEKVPIYKQKSVVAIEKAPDRRRSTTATTFDADSPYNFTDDEEEKKEPEAVKDGNETSTSTDQTVNPAPVDELKQKMVEEEVAKKLQQISSLHPELKISNAGDKDAALRHVLPKKRQNWQMGDSRHLSLEGDKSTLPENKFMKRKSTTSSSVFVKTEILTDDYSTAMPSVRAAKVIASMSLSTEPRSETEETGGMDRTLLPKLIIRIPKKCLESTPSSSTAFPVPNGSIDNEDFGDADRLHHRRRKRDKRKLHDNEVDESGKKRRHKRHKGRNVDECGDECQDDACLGGNVHRKSTSEYDTSDQDVKDINLIKNAAALLQEKKESGSNGLEWDRLPFKLRKKLHIPTGTIGIESAGQGKATESNSFNASASNNDGNNQVEEEQHRELADDNEALTSLRLRFPTGPVFQKGAFVVCKDDIGKPDCPLWKVDSQNLLQKFSPSDRQGRLVYVSTSTFAGWCLQNQDLYAPVQVRYVMQSRSESVIELESSLEEIFPAISTEITDEHQRNVANGVANLSSSDDNGLYALMDHPQTEALVTYVHVLLLHALLGNTLQSLRNSHNPNNGERYSRMKEVDLLNAEKCARSISCVNWQLAFKELVEWYPHCTISEDEGFGLQCQACGSASVYNVLQLFANEGYDFETLEPRPPRTTASGSPLPSQDYHLCSSCATVAVRYHKLFHMRYHLFRKCEDMVELVRDGNPTLAAGAVAEACIKNKKWLSNTLNEYLQVWSSVG